MARTIAPNRKSVASRRREAERQLDLFVRSHPTPVATAPTWRELPEQARTDLTCLITRLMLDHAVGGGSALRQEVGDDL
jgi:hypothetical protein